MRPADALSFDQLEFGQEWTSEGRLIRADDIHEFADLTGDRNPIHLDPAYAATTPYRQCIAHGLLGVAISSGLALDAPKVRTITLLHIREWRFAGPIFIGDEVRVRNRVVGKTPRGVGRRGEVEWQVQVVNQRGEVVQEGVTATLVEGQAVARRPRQPQDGAARA